jgi:hypothetical protein
MRNSILILAVVLSSAVHTQPVITVLDGPAIGDAFAIRSGTFVMDQGSGSGLTWDYSSIGGGIVTNVSIDEASTSSYASTFPDADLVMTGGFSDDFISNDATGLFVHGYASLFSTVILSDPSKQLAYPMQMGSTWTDDYSGLQGSLMFDGTLTCLVNGYGDVVMPYGTVNNVLRISCSNDQIAFTTPQTIQLDSIVLYYKNDFPWYLIRSTRRTIYQNGIPQGQQNTLVYSAPVGTDIDDLDLAGLGIDLYPNPATSTLTVNATVPDGEIVLTVYTSDGKMIQQQNFHASAGVVQRSVNVEDLPPGLYVVEVQEASGNVGRRQFMIH